MNKRLFTTLMLILLCVLTSCSLLHKEPDPSELYTPTPVPTDTPLPEPVVLVTEVPDPIITADAFLKAWQAENYEVARRMLGRVDAENPLWLEDEIVAGRTSASPK